MCIISFITVYNILCIKYVISNTIQNKIIIKKTNNQQMYKGSTIYNSMVIPRLVK